jgi:hypothetical protein
LSSAGPRRTVGGVRDPITALESAIRSLPEPTRVAMLDGIRSHPIVCGAYTDGRGGICPMLAAHRNGGRTNFGTFARAWDAFTGANQRKPRRASRLEVRILENYLEMSLLREGVSGESISERPLADEVRDIQATRRRLAAAEAQEASDLSVDDVLVTAYAGHAHTEERLPEPAEPDSAEAWSAELERAEAELQRSGS